MKLRSNVDFNNVKIGQEFYLYETAEELIEAMVMIDERNREFVQKYIGDMDVLSIQRGMDIRGYIICKVDNNTQHGQLFIQAITSENITCKDLEVIEE